MEVQFTENKLIELFIEIDDLLQAYESYKATQTLGRIRQPTRVPALSGSEVCTIWVCYHYSGYKCFEYYYKNKVLKELREYFPNVPTYETFLQYIPKAKGALYLWLLYTCGRSDRTGLYYIDSKRLQVCHLKRQHSNKVFKDIARKGKSSMGWFFGFKLHLVVNQIGQVVAFDLTTGNVADNNQNLLKKLLANLQGYCIGDKGYHTKLFAFFYENGLHLLTKPKKNMKHRITTEYHNKLIDKRGLIESVFDILTSVCDLEHTRHRNPDNAFAHMIAAVIAYQYLNKKPALFFPSIDAKIKSAA